MKRALLKLAAYIVLCCGILLILACILGSIAVFMVYPDANSIKIILVAVGLVIVAAIIAVITFALFEVIIDDISGKRLSLRRRADGGSGIANSSSES